MTEAARRMSIAGAPLGLRRIRPSDSAALRHLAYEGLSERSRRARFRGLPFLSDDAFVHLCTVDGRDHVALVAERPGGELVGVGRFIRLRDRAKAEVALSVADAYQRHGIGRALLDSLVPIARSVGVRTLIAFAGADNVGIARLLCRQGGELRRDGDGEVVITLPLDESA